MSVTLSPYDPAELTNELLVSLFREMDALLEGHPTKILVVGGAALTMYWAEQGRPRDQATYDVDVLPVLDSSPDRTTFKVDVYNNPLPRYLRDAVDTVTRKYEMDDHWFNNDVIGVMQYNIDYEPEILFEGTNFTVYRPSARALLVTKLMAGRDKDQGDTSRLIQELGITSVGQMLQLIEDLTGTPPFFVETITRFGVDRLRELGIDEPGQKNSATQ